MSAPNTPFPKMPMFQFGQGMKQDCKNTSVPLDGGGDSHMHLGVPGAPGNLMATTRLPGIPELNVPGGVKEMEFHTPVEIRDDAYMAWRKNVYGY